MSGQHGTARRAFLGLGENLQEASMFGVLEVSRIFLDAYRFIDVMCFVAQLVPFQWRKVGLSQSSPWVPGHKGVFVCRPRGMVALSPLAGHTCGEDVFRHLDLT